MKVTYITIIFILSSYICSAFVILPTLPTAKKFTVHTFVRKREKIYHKCNYQKYSDITNNKQSSLFCNIPLTPDIYKLIFVYFTQGIYTIYRVYLSFYYKDVLHLTPYDLTIISTIPLIIKPIYEFLPELFPLFTYKKNAFLLLSGILGSISWALLAFLTILISNGQLCYSTIPALYSISIIVLSSLGLTFSDILTDAISTSVSSFQNNTGALQYICKTSSSIGSIICAYFSGSILPNHGSAFIFTLTAIIPIIMFFTTRLIHENKLDVSFHYHSDIQHIHGFRKFKKKLKDISNTLSQSSILYHLAFLLILNSSPNLPLLYFEVNHMSFQPEFLEKLGFISSISSLIKIILYNKKLKHMQ